MRSISSDPFEQAFYDYLAGDIAAKVAVHNNKGDVEIMPVSYFFRSYEEMPKLEQKALNLCAGKVLDIGAGSGSHALYLQEKDFDITALDIRKGFVDVMIQRGLKSVVCSDIFKFDIHQFDTLLMMMNGIGFSKNFNGLENFLKHAKSLLNNGGQIVLDSSDLLYLYREEDGSLKIDLNESYYGEVEYQVEYQGKKGEPFKWLFIDYSNLEFYAEKSGFRSELVFEDEHFNYLARLY